MRKITLLLILLSFSFSLSAQTYLQENFDTEIPATWTITDEGAATGDTWASGQQGGFNDLDGTAGAFVDSDANGNGTQLIETLTSPVFDTTGAVGLFLDFDQFYRSGGSDSGIVEVYDGTNWVEVLNLTSTTGSFANPDQQHIDITAYSNANMQIRFIYDDGDTWAWYWMIDNIEVLNSLCDIPTALAANNVGGTTADITWDMGTITAWEYVIQAQGTGVPTGNGIMTTSNTINATALDFSTDYEVYVRSDCGGGTYSDWVGPLNFTTTVQTDFTVDCAVGPQTLNYCYTANDSNVFTFTSIDGSGLTLTINSGQVENNWDELVVTDVATGTDLNAGTPYGNAGDVGGLTFQSSGDSVTLAITSDGSVSCNTNGFTPLDVTVVCSTCTNPTAAYAVVSDCINGPQFFVETDITDLGTATSLTVSDNQGNSQVVSATGVVSFGPFTNNTDVVITVTNDDDGNCFIVSDSLTQEICLDQYVDCTVGPTNFVYCYENNDSNVFTFTSNDGTPLTFIINSGEVEDGWDELIVLDTDGVTDLNAATPYGTDGDGDVGGLIYQSTGDTISFQVQSDGSINCSGNGFIPLDISVSCATCIFQDVEFTAVDDCDSGTDQFFIDVNVVDLGSAVTLDINDGTTTVSTTTTGVVQIGPYPVNTDVTVVVSNQDDSNCITTSSVLNIPACPPANDDCENAIVALANADSNCTNITSGTIYGATQSPQGNTCFGTANDDVWFSFEALATDHAVSLLNVAGDTTNMSFGLYEGADCNTLTNIACPNNGQIVANGLTIGETYYVQVFSSGNLPFQNTTFDLCIISLPPPITTNTDQYTVQELVEDVLIDSPCSLVSNITFSTGTDFGSTNGIGYFEQNGSDFPFESGVILTTGDVLNAPGPESGTLSDGANAWPGDADLENEIGLPLGQTRNATVLEFDFVPVTPEISFDFIFAAEEYGTFQCTFSDAFAFLLTDAAGNTVNLAVVPGTTTPISVLNVRDEAFNGGCPSVNPEYFDAYYNIFDFPGGIGQNPLTSPTNFGGRTVPLTAMATVIPNNSYSIKLVIADDQDRLFDSAVFLSAGSFDIGEIDLGDDILLTSGNANCLGDEVVLDIGIDIPNNSVLTWYFTDPEIPGILEPIEGENGPTLTVNETGIYTAEILITGTSCFFMDEVLIEFFPNPIVAFAEDYVIKCANEDYDISINLENSADITNTLTYNFYIAGELVQSTSSNSYTLTAQALEQGNITATVVDDVTGCLGEAAMLVEFYENANCVDQPQGLSPNNDGVNDCLILDHLEDRRDITKAEIFNRYGVKVWELKDYVDEWCGTDQDGKLLPVGTYYYNVYLNNVEKPLTTFIYLNY